VRDFCVGSAFGLFLGLLIGLSASEVVAGVITALVALLGMMLGLRSEAGSGPLPGGNGARIAGFAIVGSITLLCAVMARTHGLLEPSPAFVRDRWVEARFSPDEAKEIAAFQRLGLVPHNRSVGEAKASNAATGALYANSIKDDACQALHGRTYGTASAMISAMRAEGGDWENLAENLPSGADDAAKIAVLRARVAERCLRL
jgi:hypothetical protein